MQGWGLATTHVQPFRNNVTTVYGLERRKNCSRRSGTCKYKNSMSRFNGLQRHLTHSFTRELSTCVTRSSPWCLLSLAASLLAQPKLKRPTSMLSTSVSTASTVVTSRSMWQSDPKAPLPSFFPLALSIPTPSPQGRRTRSRAQ